MVMDDVIEDILLRIPPEDPASLVRAALVCKRWRRTISDSGFRRRFHQFHRAPPMLGFLYWKPGYHRFKPISSFRPPYCADHSSWCPVDARHGRILFVDEILIDNDSKRMLEFIILNPTSGDEWRLPVVRCKSILDTWSAALLCVAAGCNHLDCPSTAFRVVYVSSEFETGSTSACIFSPDNHAWRQTSSIEHLDDVIQSCRCTLAGDALYFTFMGEAQLLEFGLDNHEFSLINLPSECKLDPVLMAANDGRLGVAVLEDFNLRMWWRHQDKWAQGSATCIKNMLHDGARSTAPRLLTVADGGRAIFTLTSGGALYIDLMSERVTEIGGVCEFVGIVPYISFCLPGKPPGPAMDVEHGEDLLKSNNSSYHAIERQNEELQHELAQLRVREGTHKQTIQVLQEKVQLLEMQICLLLPLLMMTVLLSQLHSSSFSSAIRVRISRMWEYRGTSDDGDLKHLDLIVVDEKNNSMYVEIPPDAVPVLRPTLQEGRIIIVRNFLVENAKLQFKVVDAPCMIRLNKRTEISQVYPEPPDFPRYVYTLTPIAELPKHDRKKNKFLDVIGQVVSVSNAALVRNAFGQQQMKRTVMLKDESENTVQVSLWGSRASEFSGRLVYDAGQKGPVIVIFVGTLFTSNEGAQLSGTSACRWYINEDIPPINGFYTRLPPEVEPVERLQLDNDHNIPSEIWLKTVLQLKDICPFEQATERFRCTVTITRLSAKQSWLYSACTACHARIRLGCSDYTFKNGKCSCTEMFNRYKLCLMGSDGTYELKFVLFDNVAQQLIGKPVEVLQSKYNIYDTPVQISSLVGQKYTFIVRISKRKTVESKNDDPSFEVVDIAQQYGRETKIPTIHANELLIGSSSSFQSVPSVPLVPIRSKITQDANTVIPPMRRQSKNDPMEVKQMGNNIQEILTGNKRTYRDMLSHPQQGIADDPQDDANNSKKGRL